MDIPRTPQFGAILYRATQLIVQQGQDAFDHLGIEFDARKISIVLCIHKLGPLTSSQISSELGHSRQLVESRLKQLVNENFLTGVQADYDSRKKVYGFSADSAYLVESIVRSMMNFEAVYSKLWSEIGCDLEDTMLRFEEALANKPLSRRYDEYKLSSDMQNQISIDTQEILS